MTTRAISLLLLTLSAFGSAAQAQELDLVLLGGRVMDPDLEGKWISPRHQAGVLGNGHTGGGSITSALIPNCINRAALPIRNPNLA